MQRVNEPIKRVGVGGFDPGNELWSALADLFPVEFVPFQAGIYYDGLILLPGASNASRATLLKISKRILLYEDRLSPGQIPGLREVNLSDTPQLEAILRGKKLVEDRGRESAPLSVEPGDEILGESGGVPFWSCCRVEDVRFDILAVPPPEKSHSDCLADHFSRERFIGLLPLLHFLRDLTQELAWVRPPLRACLMFDDPNLHWGSYGFVNFKAISEHARQHHYHVAFATIPFDAWGSSQAVVSLFLGHPRELSLLIHGNNHTHCEFGEGTSEAEQRQLVAQALRRMDRFEKKAGVSISRVMAAPHGACSERAGEAMRRLGFEAACVSRGSLLKSNPHTTWAPSFGLNIVEKLGGGLPVIPRFRLSCDCASQVLFSAYLGQPIIPVGHHQDLADGLGLLEDAARAINQLGPVVWSDMKGIARTNYSTRRIGGGLQVRMHARRIHVPVDEGVTDMSFVSNCGGADEIEVMPNTVCRPARDWIRLDPVNPVIDVSGMTAIDVRLKPADAILPGEVSAPHYRLWPVVRRLMKESYDRVQPCWRGAS
jgi:hypothetical protein